MKLEYKKFGLSFQIWWLVRGMEVIKNTSFQLNLSKIITVGPNPRKTVSGEQHNAG